MIMSKRIGVLLLAGILWLGGLEFGEWLGGLELGGPLSTPGIHSFVSTAEAVVGRPLSPVSVAGVARRTSRRN
jgi:hypothetical protein